LNGQYSVAIDKYRALIERYGDGPDVQEARFRLGETLLADQQPRAAIAALQAYREAHPNDAQHPEATALLAQAYIAAGRRDQAVQLLREYRNRPGDISGYLSLAIGRSLLAANQPGEAVRELTHAAGAPMARNATIDALLALAQAQEAAADRASAIATLDRITPLARTDAFRAEIIYRQGVVFLRGGQREHAAARFLQIVNQYPTTGWAEVALRELRSLNVAVGAWQQGLVYFHNDRDADAVAALTAALAAAPDSAETPNALYMRGVANRYLGGAALSRASADLERVYTEFPTHYRAADAMYQSAIVLELRGLTADAVGRFRRVAEAYPTSERRDDALIRAAMASLALGDSTNPPLLLQQVIARPNRPENAARAGLWLGKLTNGRSDPARAQQIWAAAATAAPDDFFALRAAALRAGELSPSATFVDRFATTPDESDDRLAIMRWLATWTNASQASSDGSPGPSLMAQPAFRRIAPLLAIGMEREALEEARDLATRLLDDPVSLAQLAMWLSDQRLYSASSQAAELLLSVAPNKSFASAPPAVQRLILPTPYRAIVTAEARARNVDPLLLYA
ncbi:MAG: tetratricopeptide repeat protein, partial [Dehalococcoidia bacterium]|nr:tetratricopeptide repeat protein [Dehalococcoidia bacterium]